jgi:hypothetical protein
MQIDHDPKERPAKLDALSVFSNIVAAAILLPLGWWINHRYGLAIENWLRTIY